MLEDKTFGEKASNTSLISMHTKDTEYKEGTKVPARVSWILNDPVIVQSKRRSSTAGIKLPCLPAPRISFTKGSVPGSVPRYDFPFLGTERVPT